MLKLSVVDSCGSRAGLVSNAFLMNSVRESRAALDAAAANEKGVCLLFGAALNVFAGVESLLRRGVPAKNIIAVTEEDFHQRENLGA